MSTAIAQKEAEFDGRILKTAARLDYIASPLQYDALIVELFELGERADANRFLQDGVTAHGNFKKRVGNQETPTGGNPIPIAASCSLKDGEALLIDGKIGKPQTDAGLTEIGSAVIDRAIASKWNTHPGTVLPGLVREGFAVVIGIAAAADAVAAIKGRAPDRCGLLKRNLEAFVLVETEILGIEARAKGEIEAAFLIEQVCFGERPFE